MSATATAPTTVAPTPQVATPILAVKNIEAIYDHVILVLKGVSLVVPEGGIVAILGANGAGKSNFLDALRFVQYAVLSYPAGNDTRLA